jgi:phosphotransferase system HPr (HPr) family protein
MTPIVVTTIKNPTTFNVRAVAQFVETANKFTAQVRVSVGDKECDGKSVLSLLQLSPPPGSALTIKAQGEDATNVLQALHDCLENRLGGMS